MSQDKAPEVKLKLIDGPDGQLVVDGKEAFGQLLLLSDHIDALEGKLDEALERVRQLEG